MKTISILAVLLTLSFNANAALLQDKDITYSYQVSYTGTGTFTELEGGRYRVGNDVEITNSGALSGATIDFSDTNILLTFSGNGLVRPDRDFSGFVISDAYDGIDKFLDVTINAATNVTGFSLSMITVLTDSITVDLRGFTFTDGSILSLDINPPSAVPIPAALFMFAPALLGFLGFRRKMQA